MDDMIGESFEAFKTFDRLSVEELKRVSQILNDVIYYKEIVEEAQRLVDNHLTNYKSWYYAEVDGKFSINFEEPEYNAYCDLLQIVNDFNVCVIIMPGSKSAKFDPLISVIDVFESDSLNAQFLNQCKPHKLILGIYIGATAEYLQFKELQSRQNARMSVSAWIMKKLRLCD